MSLFDEVDGLLNDTAPEDPGNPTPGKHKVVVTNVYTNDERGRIDVKLKFSNNVVRTLFLYLKSQKGPGASKKALGYTVRQLNAAGFSNLKSGAAIEKAIGQLKGMTLLVEVENKPDSQYQNYTIIGAEKRQPVEMADTDDVPF